MKKLILYALLTAAALTAGSCRKAVENARENIRLEAIEDVKLYGTAGIQIVARVANGTNYALTLDQAQIDIYHQGAHIGRATLRQAVEVPRQTTASVATSWKLMISDPLALYAMVYKINENDISQICVSITADGYGGAIPINISREMMPLSEILSTFGISMDEVKNYFQ